MRVAVSGGAAAGGADEGAATDDDAAAAAGTGDGPGDGYCDALLLLVSLDRIG
ncbi:hypothetical protein GOARA_066_00030 [Gordonia araii NBRC 100433]|uniref:Uncharacterized protein n=1 Tax=Gordonia araii NBRC 100433 TaxID=1073574 RepID=G7H5X7_9ACTN|nr:hypothetical protein GOARA_066_00030 [Gordonia araii NBRC 100433]